jgi:hypothetical protein
MIYVDVFSRHSRRKTSENHESHSQDRNNPAKIRPEKLPKQYYSATVTTGVYMFCCRSEGAMGIL